MLSLTSYLFLLFTTLTLISAAPSACSSSNHDNNNDNSNTGPNQNPQICNGAAAYCSEQYSNITQIGAHDSPFVGPLPTQNQNLPVTGQLDLGIRFLQGQTHANIEDNSILEMCHTSCFLENAGTLQSYLVTVKKWLDANPNEVVTLLLTNGDSFRVEAFDRAFEGAGIKEYVFVPQTSGSGKVLAMDEWPTFGEMIQNGDRLVVFLDYGADTSKVPYILDEFAYFFETPYDVTDASFSGCKIDRPPNASPAGRMYIVNHFLDVDILGILVPDREHADRTNSVSGMGSIGAQCKLCKGMYGRLPNVVLVDFVDQGKVIKAQRQLNGL